MGRLFENIDWVTVGLYLLLVTFGLINILGASYNGEEIQLFQFSTYFGKQSIWILLSLGLAILILLLDIRLFIGFSYPFYGLMVVLLFVTIFISKAVGGAHSWIDFGFFKFQPTEFAKFGTALALANFLGDSSLNFRENRVKWLAAILIGLPVFAILLQNDTGSALVFIGLIFPLYREGLSGNILLVGFYLGVLTIMSLIIEKHSLVISLLGIGLVYYSGFLKDWFKGGLIVFIYFLVVGLMNWFDLNSELYFGWASLVFIIGAYFIFSAKRDRFKKNKVQLLAALVISVGFMFSVEGVYNSVLKEYQRMRIDVILGLQEDPRGVGYNTNQSKIAIGSGGFSGKGFLQGTQTKYDFVPEQRTDFIYCTVGEEWGFLGSFLVIALFVMLLLRVVYLAEKQRSRFSRVYGYCVASILFMHLLINISMTLGLGPVIGIPLPFFSYGGSSLWGFTILLFIFISLNRYRQDVIR